MKTRPRKCKAKVNGHKCGVKFTPEKPWIEWCSEGCRAAINLVKFEKDQAAKERRVKRAKKKKRVESAKKKRDFYDNDIKTRIAAAKKACHAYIRERDKGRPCICCDRPASGSMHAGHFIESGNNPKIRYHEDNIHAQLTYCNMYQGGNSDDYEGRLRTKIGDKRVKLYP